MRVRREVTVWDKCKHPVPNHIYMTEGQTLVGYIPDGTKTPVYFKEPKKQWSPARRKFKDLTAKELKEYNL